MTTNPDPHKAPIADVARFCATQLESLRQSCRHNLWFDEQLSDCTKCHGDGFCPWPITDLERWMDAAHEAGWPSTTFELETMSSSEYAVTIRNIKDWILKNGYGKTRGEALVRALARALASDAAPSETA